MNELYHHGIKGMKWGVRRYQNPDGSLTAEGKRRRNIAIIASPGGYALYKGGKAVKDKVSAAKARRKEEANYTDQQKHDLANDRMSDASTTYKYRKYLNDKELQNRVNRLNNEKRLKDLRNDEGYNKYVKEGKDILEKYGTKTIVAATLGPQAASMVGNNNKNKNKKKKKKKH